MGPDAGGLELGEPLGRGGQATVWRARDGASGAVVAAKIVEARVWEDPRLRRRLERELVALRRVRHPAVVRVIGTRELDGRGVLLMELAEGGTLADLVGERRLTPLRALSILTDVAAGLDAAHRAGIVHRDVTASNVLIRGDGSALIADFGLALGPGDAPTTTDALTCTPAYVAPEVAKGAAPGPAADRYSFAVVAFEAVTGRRPFEAPTPAGLLHAHVTAPPPAASEVAPGLPASVDAPARAGLAKNPADRPGSAIAIVEALGDGLAPRRLVVAGSRRSGRPRRVGAVKPDGPGPPGPAASSRRTPATDRSGGTARSRVRLTLARTGAGLVAGAVALGLAATLGASLLSPDGDAGEAPSASVRSVPGPDGGPRAATPLDAEGSLGLESSVPAVTATVAGVQVVALDSEADDLAADLRRAQSDRGAALDRLERDGREVAEIARARDGSAQGVLGVGRPPGARTVVLRGGAGAVETYAGALAAALPGEVSAPAPAT